MEEDDCNECDEADARAAADNSGNDIEKGK